MKLAEFCLIRLYVHQHFYCVIIIVRIDNHLFLINDYYNRIVKALSDAADLTVPCFSSNVLKAYWSKSLMN